MEINDWQKPTALVLLQFSIMVVAGFLHNISINGMTLYELMKKKRHQSLGIMDVASS